MVNEDGLWFMLRCCLDDSSVRGCVVMSDGFVVFDNDLCFMLRWCFRCFRKLIFSSAFNVGWFDTLMILICFDWYIKSRSYSNQQNVLSLRIYISWQIFIVKVNYVLTLRFTYLTYVCSYSNQQNVFIFMSLRILHIIADIYYEGHLRFTNLTAV